MWPLVLALLRSNAVRLTLPFAAVVGAIGYSLEGLISDRYTPYSKSISEKRAERLSEEEVKDPLHYEKLRLRENVLGRNLSPSLEGK